MRDSHDTRPHPAIWLVYLTFLLLGPIIFGDARDIAFTALLVVAFLPVYFWCSRHTGWRVAWGLAWITALGIAALPENPGGMTLFIYTAALSVRLGTTRRAMGALALLVLLETALVPILDLGPFFWVPALVVSVLIGFVCIHEEQMVLKNAELRQSRDEVMRLARIAERERIARDLHDLLGHTLSVIVLKGELAARLAERGDARAVGEAREIVGVARKALHEVRAAVAGYRAAGLGAELEQATQACAAAGVDLAHDIPETPLPPLVEGVLSITLREAITNVVRHSQARHCAVTLRIGEDAVELQVTDDGRGLRGGHDAPVTFGGAGMVGIRERVGALGGEVRWESRNGTTLTVRIPLRGDIDYQALGGRADAA